MPQKKPKDPVKHPTTGENLSQNQDQRRNVPPGLDKRGGQSPK